MNNLKNITNFTILRRIHMSRFKKSTEKITPVNNISSELLFKKPVVSKLDLKKLPTRTVIDAKTIALLERLSLIDCANKQGIQVLEDAIAFADQLLQVNTEGVAPLITVLEDRPLELREDEVAEGNCRDNILLNASVTEEEYLVAPPGNIPLEPRENLLFEDTKI